MTYFIRKTLIASVFCLALAAVSASATAATMTATEASFDSDAAWHGAKTAIGQATGQIASIASTAWSGYNRLAAPSAGALREVGEELRCMALNIYHEARGEPYAGQVAVAHVVMNRVASKRYPNTICEVVQQGGAVKRYRCQFSWWCDGRSDRTTDRDAWRASMRLALQIYLGYSKDPTGGAMWYHADYVSPRWRTMFARGPKIGQHIFYTVASN